MFGNKTNKASPIDSLIGAGTTINGDVNFIGGLRVDGVVRGNINAVGDKPGTLVLSEMAKIEGEIDVGHVVINGTVAGDARFGQEFEVLLGTHGPGNGAVDYNMPDINFAFNLGHFRKH